MWLWWMMAVSDNSNNSSFKPCIVSFLLLLISSVVCVCNSYCWLPVAIIIVMSFVRVNKFLLKRLYTRKIYFNFHVSRDLFSLDFTIIMKSVTFILTVWKEIGYKYFLFPNSFCWTIFYKHLNITFTTKFNQIVNF